jgi:hypothetical protein
MFHCCDDMCSSRHGIKYGATQTSFQAEVLERRVCFCRDEPPVLYDRLLHDAERAINDRSSPLFYFEDHDPIGTRDRRTALNVHAFMGGADLDPYDPPRSELFSTACDIYVIQWTCASAMYFQLAPREVFVSCSLPGICARGPVEGAILCGASAGSVPINTFSVELEVSYMGARLVVDLDGCKYGGWKTLEQRKESALP